MVGAIEEVLQPRVVRTQIKHRYTYLLLIHSFIIVIIIIIIIKIDILILVVVYIMKRLLLSHARLQRRLFLRI